MERGEKGAYSGYQVFRTGEMKGYRNGGGMIRARAGRSVPPS
jgi:hypothetical protein